MTFSCSRVYCHCVVSSQLSIFHLITVHVEIGLCNGNGIWIDKFLMDKCIKVMKMVNYTNKNQLLGSCEDFLIDSPRIDFFSHYYFLWEYFFVAKARKNESNVLQNVGGIQQKHVSINNGVYSKVKRKRKEKKKINFFQEQIYSDFQWTM